MKFLKWFINLIYTLNLSTLAIRKFSKTTVPGDNVSFNFKDGGNTWFLISTKERQKRIRKPQKATFCCEINIYVM